MISDCNTGILFIDPIPSAQHHMEMDANAIENIHSPLHSPVLRFYTWSHSGAITLGRFLAKEKLIDEKACQDRNISIAFRPTGGGLLIHGSFDCAFSLVLPQGHPLISRDVKQNYLQIHSMIERGLKRVSMVEALNTHEPVQDIDENLLRVEPYCMASKTQYDILFHGVKVGGSACRITKKGLLFQASIFVKEPDWEYFTPVLIEGERAIREMKQKSSSLSNFLSSSCASCLTIPAIQRHINSAIYEGLASYTS